MYGLRGKKINSEIVFREPSPICLNKPNKPNKEYSTEDKVQKQQDFSMRKEHASIDANNA